MTVAGDYQDCYVTLEGVRVSYGSVNVITGVSAKLGPRGFHVIIGPNGAGKTTLLKSISGIVPFEGVIRVCGLHPRLATRLISYSPSTPSYDPWARVIDVIEAGLYNSPEGASLERALHLMRSLGAEEWLYKRFGELSSGEQKLVDLVRSMARNPRVLLLDEPLAFLDLRNQARILKLLKSLSKRITVIASMHELYFLDYSDHVILMGGGKIVYSGAPRGLLLDLVRETYNIDVVEAMLGDKRVIVPGI